MPGQALEQVRGGRRETKINQLHAAMSPGQLERPRHRRGRVVMVGHRVGSFRAVCHRRENESVALVPGKVRTTRRNENTEQAPTVFESGRVSDSDWRRFAFDPGTRAIRFVLGRLHDCRIAAQAMDGEDRPLVSCSRSAATE